jgi:crossover junction endodeoxyribonuclease RuvC
VLFSKNVRTAMATGQAAGVALLAAAQSGLPVVSYAPTDVKLAVAGSGAADKDAVGRMVAAQLRLDEVPRPADVADALAVALCHLGRARLAAATATTPAAGALAEAHRQARSAGRDGWAAVLDRPHVREAGGA